MEEIFAYVLEFILTFAKMQNNSTLKWKKFEIWGWSILKVIQAFHTVRIVLYIGCSGTVGGSLTTKYWFFSDSKLLGQNTWYTSFCYLGDVFCWWGLWNNGHYLCENSLEEVQGATTSSHLTIPVAMYPALACGVPCSMPVKHGHSPRRTCSACSPMIGPWSDISAVSSQRMWPL